MQNTITLDMLARDILDIWDPYEVWDDYDSEEEVIEAVKETITKEPSVIIEQLCSIIWHLQGGAA